MKYARTFRLIQQYYRINEIIEKENTDNNGLSSLNDIIDTAYSIQD